MKKIYLLSSALVLATSAIAQNVENPGSKVVVGRLVEQSAPTVSPDRITCPDTTGLINFTEFLPDFNPTGSGLTIWSYTGGGYIFGNNKDQFNMTAQGYANLNPSPVKIQGAIAWFRYKQRDGAGGSTSKVTIGAYAVAPNNGYNTDGSGTFNSTVKNWVGPTTLYPVTTASLLYDNIDTVPKGYATRGNYVAFATPPTFTGDFALSLDARTTTPYPTAGTPNLTAGDTVGLLADANGDAGNLDYCFCLASGYAKWYATDQIYSSAAAPALGSGGLDNDMALFAVFCDATGVEEYFNGMKLTAYPIPANENVTIEYTLEKNSNNVSLTVFDLLGKEISLKEVGSQSAGTYRFNVETAELPAGNYFYQLRSNGNNFTKKFVVSH